MKHYDIMLNGELEKPKITDPVDVVSVSHTTPSCFDKSSLVFTFFSICERLWDAVLTPVFETKSKWLSNS